MKTDINELANVKKNVNFLSGSLELKKKFYQALTHNSLPAPALNVYKNFTLLTLNI